MLQNKYFENSMNGTLCIENSKKRWKKVELGDLTLHIKGDISAFNANTLHCLIQENNQALTFGILRKWLKSIPINYALIGSVGKQVFAVTDCIGSTPIFYTFKKNPVIISDSSTLLAERIGRSISENINEDAWLAFEMSGYTIGSSTLHSHIRRLKPGELLIANKAKFSLARHHRYQPWDYAEKCPSKLRDELSGVTLAVFEKLVKNSHGRQIAVPISAGLDSRLVASALKHIGAKNVICFSYGQSGNFDATTGRTVAERLGYPWHFILTNSKIQKRLFSSTEHKQYMKYADNYSSVPFRQDIVPIRELLSSGVLQPNAIIVNGNSGDFISGGHIPGIFFNEQISCSLEIDSVINEIIKKHFSLWTNQRHPAVIERLKKIIFDELVEEGLTNHDARALFGVFEFSEFTNRQSKFVIGGQRIYEFFDLDWELPLWDHTLLDFWGKVPLSLKKNQLLYQNTLFHNNWGGVWLDFPINKKNISPAWIRPLRNMLKIGFAPFGRENWHNFERRYLAYFTDVVGNYSIYPYRDIVSSKSIARNSVAWHVYHYLDGITQKPTPE